MTKRTAIVAGALVIALGAGFIAGWLGHHPPPSRVTAPLIARVVVPDLVGWRVSRATALLQIEGLNGQSEGMVLRPHETGYVVQQIPMGGTEAAKGATVQLWVSAAH